MEEPRQAFGQAEPGVEYRQRPCAFGLVEKDGRIACVKVDRGEVFYFDLPGGAIDGEETEQEALAREFVEETGLAVTARRRIGQTSQVFRRSTGEPVRNLAGVWIASLEGENPLAKIEDDHELVWLDPLDAVARLRHEAHAWAVALWLRVR